MQTSGVSILVHTIIYFGFVTIFLIAIFVHIYLSASLYYCILFSFILGSEHYSDQFQTVFENLVLAVLRVFSVVLETIWYLLLELYWTFIYWLLMLFIMSYKVARFHINYVSSCWYYLDQYLPYDQS